jgi:hypothetical protein
VHSGDRAGFTILALLAGGLAGGALAAWVTRPIYFWLYSQAVALASRIDSLLAYVVLVALLVLATPFSGALAGALGSAPWLAGAWLAGWRSGAAMRWALLWPLAGALAWGALALTRTVDPLAEGPVWWWLPLGALVGIGAALLAMRAHVGLFR